MENIHDGKLTSKSYWDKSYQNPRCDELRIDGFRNRCEAKIFALLEKELSPGMKVLEIGAGDSLWLPFLAKRFPNIKFAGLDYSELGCERLDKRAAGLNIEIICEDFLKPQAERKPEFDLIISFGVFEHFQSLDLVVRAVRKYLVANGRVFTVIPNMSGLLGMLVNCFNRDIYLAHNPHTKEDLISGHQVAGFEILSSGYLCSVNFGVLSSAVTRNTKISYFIYLWLSRLTKLVFFLEENLFDFPTTKLFSPYVYCVGTKKESL